MDLPAYIKAQADMLNALSTTGFSPDLTQLDKLVGSLEIEGVPGTGLQDTVWQWLDTHWYETKNGANVLEQNPITNPAQYQVAYKSDGTVQVKADCNNAGGTYIHEGGAAGSVRVEIGPVTLAVCGPGSRSEEFVQSLVAAQGFRVKPGGDRLELNMPVGGPVLAFENAGSLSK